MLTRKDIIQLTVIVMAAKSFRLLSLMTLHKPGVLSSCVLILSVPAPNLSMQPQRVFQIGLISSVDQPPCPMRGSAAAQLPFVIIAQASHAQDRQCRQPASAFRQNTALQQ